MTIKTCMVSYDHIRTLHEVIWNDLTIPSSTYALGLNITFDLQEENSLKVDLNSNI